MGLVFNIQRFSTRDGPGIRTTVFLKGCNLNCAWCHNPEAIAPQAQLQFFFEKCSQCGRCAAACAKGAHGFNAGAHTFNRELCNACGACIESCYSDALRLAGAEMTAQTVIEVVLKDKRFYDQSGGGLTISGGEPLMQRGFTLELLRAAKAHGIHTAIDTAALAEFSVFEKLLPEADLILLDIKCMDQPLHKRLTGASNEIILDNVKRLVKMRVPLIVRIPLIGGINDDAQNASETAAVLRNGNVLKVELLPYHSLGVYKASSIGKTMQKFLTPPSERLAAFAGHFKCEVTY